MCIKITPFFRSFLFYSPESFIETSYLGFCAGQLGTKIQINPDQFGEKKIRRRIAYRRKNNAAIVLSPPCRSAPVRDGEAQGLRLRATSGWSLPTVFSAASRLFSPPQRRVEVARAVERCRLPVEGFPVVHGVRRKCRRDIRLEQREQPQGIETFLHRAYRTPMFPAASGDITSFFLSTRVRRRSRRFRRRPSSRACCRGRRVPSASETSPG